MSSKFMNVSSRVSTWERQVPVNYSVQQGVNRVSSIQVDDRPLSPRVSRNCQGYNAKGVSSHSKHYKGFDMYDKCKVATALRWRTYKKCKGVVQPQRQQWRKIIVNNGEYECKVKASHVLSKCQELASQGVKFSVEIM